MAKIDVMKTELVWPGKYDEDGALRETPRVNLPFQIIETRRSQGVQDGHYVRDNRLRHAKPERLLDRLITIRKWSDWIDYWAVDWDFRNDTFMQGWVAYRTRKDRTLPLASDPHVYERPGRRRVLVKVIDVFGNDTSQAFDVEV